MMAESLFPLLPLKLGAQKLPPYATCGHRYKPITLDLIPDIGVQTRSPTPILMGMLVQFGIRGGAILRIN